MDKEEWEDRRSLKPMFETAGVTVASMSEEEFLKQSVATERFWRVTCSRNRKANAVNSRPYHSQTKKAG